MNDWISSYNTKIEASIAYLEHELMINGHEKFCPICNNRAWPLEPPEVEPEVRIIRR